MRAVHLSLEPGFYSANRQCGRRGGARQPRWLSARHINPYVGLRVGYGRLQGSNFVAAGEAGVEVFKHRHGVLDLSVRGTAFLGEGGPDVALVSGAGLTLAW
ncbi:MAG: hypothetical protein GY811_30755 [Myxococcales bacterium]|nr:hypothetical protein [Myxococcales bacterium]